MQAHMKELKAWEDNGQYKVMLEEYHKERQNLVAEIVGRQEGIEERDKYISDLDARLQRGREKLRDLEQKLHKQVETNIESEEVKKEHQYEVSRLEQAVDFYKGQWYDTTKKLEEAMTNVAADSTTAIMTSKNMACVGLLLNGLLLLIPPLLLWLFGLVPSCPPCDNMAADPSSALADASTASSGQRSANNPLLYFIIFIIAYVTAVGFVTLRCLRMWATRAPTVKAKAA